MKFVYATLCLATVTCPVTETLAEYRKKRRKKDKVAQPSEWVNLFRETVRTNSFRVVYVEHPLTDGMLAYPLRRLKIQESF